MSSHSLCSEPASPKDGSIASRAKLRAGVLCFRLCELDAGLAQNVEFLLVTRRSRSDLCNDRYTIPAGKFEVETDASMESCALREAEEEAGVECESVADLGWFASRSKHNEPIKTRYFLARCLRELETWEEHGQRARCWVLSTEAMRLASYREDLERVVSQGLKAALQSLQDAARPPQLPPKPPPPLDSLGRLFVTDEGPAEKEEDAVPPQRRPPPEPFSGSGLGQLFDVEAAVPERPSAAPAPAAPLRPLRPAALLSSTGGNDGCHCGLDTLFEDEACAHPPPSPAISHCKGSNTNGSGESPEKYTFYSNQVGGHFCLVKPAPGSLVEVEPAADGLCGPGDDFQVQGSRVLLKPMDDAEFRFYSRLQGDRKTQPLLHFTPRFYGTKTLRREQIASLALQGMEQGGGLASLDAKRAFWEPKWHSHNCRRYIVLEDLGSKAAKACFMDLKMGCRQRSARHSFQKRRNMAVKAKRTTSAELGFRICGMQSYDARAGAVQFYDKYWGQNVSADVMSEALRTFLPRVGDPGCPAEEGRAREDVIRAILQQLAGLRQAVEQLPGLRFWSSSLLLGFDAAPAEEEGRGEELLRSVQLKMIDFTHFADVGGDSPDEEYLCGVDNFRAHLEALLEGRGKEEASAWLAGRLRPPPPSESQDAEEEMARQQLESDGCAFNRATSGPADDGLEEVMLAANAQTISGVTGQKLMRELAAHRRALGD